MQKQFKTYGKHRFWSPGENGRVRGQIPLIFKEHRFLPSCKFHVRLRIRGWLWHRSSRPTLAMLSLCAIDVATPLGPQPTPCGISCMHTTRELNDSSKSDQTDRGQIGWATAFHELDHSTSSSKQAADAQLLDSHV